VGTFLLNQVMCVLPRLPAVDLFVYDVVAKPNSPEAGLYALSPMRLELRYTYLAQLKHRTRPPKA